MLSYFTWPRQTLQFVLHSHDLGRFHDAWIVFALQSNGVGAMRRSHVEFLKRVTFTNRPSITVTVNVFCAHGLLANFGQNTFFPQMIMYLLPKAYSPAKLSDTMGRSMYCKEYLSLYVHIIVYTGVPKKRAFRMLLEPRCTGSITSSRHPLRLEINFVAVSY